VRLSVVVSRSQSDRLSGTRVDAPIQPGALFFLFFLLPGYGFPES
jgi:hypothetical protein